jgi:tetratricopeptide (TPR) repeat protein
MLPAYSFGAGAIQEINITKDDKGLNTILLKSDGSFKYYVHASQNDLYIDLKNADIPEDIGNILTGNTFKNDNIQDIKLLKKDQDIKSIVISLKEIKDFQFTVASEKGKPAPYGFGSDLNKKINRNYKPPQRTLTQEKKPFLRTEKITIPEPQQSVTQDVTSSRESQELIIPSGPSLGRISKNNSSLNYRLDETSVVVPENYLNSSDTSEVSEEVEEGTSLLVEEITPSVEIVKEDKPEPLSTEDLLKLLNSDNDSNSDLPRLVQEDNADQTLDQLIEKNENPNEEVAPVPEITEAGGLIASVTEIQKGQFIEGQAHNAGDLVPEGGKIIELNHQVSSEDPPGLIEKNHSNYLKPRPLNSFSLGLSEQFISETHTPPRQDLLKPKPTYTSDGKVALKIISSTGIQQKEAKITPLNHSPARYSFAAIEDERVTSIDQQQYKTQKTEFKRLILLAREFYNQNRMTEAETAFNKAILLNPDQPWGYITVADFYEAQKRYPEAIKAYEKALTLLPGKVELLYNLAMVHYRQHNNNQAITYLNHVIQRSPRFTLAFYNLGTLYYQMQDYDLAIKYLSQAIKLNPVLIDAYYNLGLAYINQNKLQDATTQFEQCVNIDPDDPQCSFLLSKFHQ